MTTTDIYEFFASLNGDDRCIIIDTFASLCWMHQQGHKRPAIKLMRDLLFHANKQKEVDCTDLIIWLLENIDGKEEEFANAVPARVEFRQLFPKK